jgi:hypothetical protein
VSPSLSDTSPPARKGEEVKVSENSIQNTFFGQRTQIMKICKPGQEQDIKNKKTEKLGPIMLDIQYNRLYESWDEAFRTQVMDYIDNSSGETCIQESWINKLPSVLCFNLNRVQYDQKSQRIVKNMSKFTFDKQIYADMFLYKNRARADQMRKQISQIKLKLKELQKCIAEYHNQAPSQ